MTSIKELADLSTVIDHLKVTLNAVGRNILSKEEYKKLTDVASKLEKQFLEGAGSIEFNVSNVDIHKTIAEARRKMQKEKDPSFSELQGSSVSITDQGAVVVEASPEKQETELPVEAEPSVTLSKTETKEDVSLASRLAQEKKNLAKKGKRKTV